MRTSTRPRWAGFVVLIAAVGLSSTFGTASAQSNTPGKPIIESITATAGDSAGTVTVTVMFGRAGTKPWATVQATEVKIGSVSCLTTRLLWKLGPDGRGPFATCTASGVKASRTVKVVARAKNMYGFGPWGDAVMFRTRVGTTWKRAANP